MVVEGIVIPLLIKLRFGKTVNVQESMDILEEAKGITKNDYMAYLNNAIEGMKKDFSELVR